MDSFDLSALPSLLSLSLFRPGHWEQRAPPLKGHQRASVFVRPVDDLSPLENAVMQQRGHPCCGECGSVCVHTCIHNREPFLGRENILACPHNI